MKTQTIILKDNQSDHFDLISYPDGQHSIKLNLDMLDKKIAVIIKCRIKTFSEMEVLLCLYQALVINDLCVLQIDFVYLFGVRSDRAFNLGEPNYFKAVLAPLLQNFKYGPYCVCFRLLWPFKPLPVIFQYVDIGTWDIDYNDNMTSLFTNEKYQYYLSDHFSAIAGDETAKQFHSDNVALCAFKKIRNNDKIITSLTDEEVGYIKNRQEKNPEDFLIVDDLCDGGATFIAGAKFLKGHFPDKKIHLFIYHGLFTKGLDPLLEYFDTIYCTNSYQDIDHPRVKQIKVI